MEIPYIVNARKDTGLNNSKIAIWLFLASEVMLFGGLFSSYIFLRIFADYPWPERALPVLPGLINTFILIASSVTVVFAWAALKLRKWKVFVFNMSFTLVCAAVFMVFKFYEYKAKLTHQALQFNSYAMVEGHLDHDTHHHGLTNTIPPDGKGTIKYIVPLASAHFPYVESILENTKGGKFILTENYYDAKIGKDGELADKKILVKKGAELSIENLEKLKDYYIDARTHNQEVMTELERAAWHTLRNEEAYNKLVVALVDAGEEGIPSFAAVQEAPNWNKPVKLKMLGKAKGEILKAYHREERLLNAPAGVTFELALQATDDNLEDVIAKEALSLATMKASQQMDEMHIKIRDKAVEFSKNDKKNGVEPKTLGEYQKMLLKDIYGGIFESGEEITREAILKKKIEAEIEDFTKPLQEIAEKQKKEAKDSDNVVYVLPAKSGSVQLDADWGNMLPKSGFKDPETNNPQKLGAEAKYKLKDSSELVGTAGDNSIEIHIDGLDFRHLVMKYEEKHKNLKYSKEDIYKIIESDRVFHTRDKNSEGAKMLRAAWAAHKQWSKFHEEHLEGDRVNTAVDNYRITWKQFVAYKRLDYKVTKDNWERVKGDLQPTMIEGFVGPDHKNEEFSAAFPHVTYNRDSIRFESVFSPKLNNYYAIYFTITGLHGLHVIGGAIVLGYYLFFGYGMYKKNPEWLANRVEVGGLFWHFVDLVWIFVFPIFYLM